MTEPKRRGRPPKAKPCAECGQVDGHYDDCPVGMGVVPTMNGDKQYWPEPNNLKAKDLGGVDPIAAAYAVRVWNGQSVNAPLAWRIERVLAALEGQGLLATGISLPPIEGFPE